MVLSVLTLSLLVAIGPLSSRKGSDMPLMRAPCKQWAVLAGWCLLALTAVAAQQLGANLPNPTHAGYLDVERNAGSKIYYQYYEADSELCSATPAVMLTQPQHRGWVLTHSAAATDSCLGGCLGVCAGPYPDIKKAPIILWLQV